MPVRFATAFVLLAATPALAQPVLLAEVAKPGDCAKSTIDLTVTGHLVVGPNAAQDTVKLDARARLVFAERTLSVDGVMPVKSARHYDAAGSSAVVGGERIERTLAGDRRLVVAQRNGDGLFCFALTGPITRDELDLVAEHFNPQCLPGLLPGKEVGPNTTWPVPDAAAIAACQFDRLLKNALVGKLIAVQGGLATFSIEGQAEGIENGGKASLSIAATGTFDIASRRVVELQWKQKDDREQSAVGPASKVEATIALKREMMPAVPPALTDAALAGIPNGEVPAALAQLRFVDPKGRYTILHPREWHVTGATDTHLILRLLDRGEFIAQATVSVWKSLPPGRHLSPDEFKKAVSESRGWSATKVLDDREVPASGGRWLYRLSAEGKLEGQPAVQNFHLLAGPQGDQLVVVVTMNPSQAAAVGTRDVALVNAIEFGSGK